MAELELVLPPVVQKALQMLEQSGFEAYVVGGCVRDSLLKKAPHDWDICTAAGPDDIVHCFEQERRIETGKQHGTITVLLDRIPLEITTFRRDGTYSDSRHPDEVFFTQSIAEDLARRDFTVNAMAFHPKKGLIDPFCGQKDLALRLLRCVGKPEERFAEDALRILRLFRFCSKLGFVPEPHTLRAAFATQDRLEQVSWERRQAELLGILRSPLPCSALEQMLKNGVFRWLISELYHTEDPLYHESAAYFQLVLALLEHTPPNAALRLALLLHGCAQLPFHAGQQPCDESVLHSAQMAEMALRRLRMDSDTICNVSTLIGHQNTLPLPEAVTIRKLLAQLGEASLRQLLELQLAKARVGLLPPETSGLLQLSGHLISQILEQGQCLSLAQLEVSGKDLVQQLDIPPGPEVGNLLNLLLQEVLENPNQNEKTHLLALAKSWHNT